MSPPFEKKYGLATNPTCWYKVDKEWKTGFFHRWAQDHEDFDNGPGHIPVALIEDATDSRVRIVYASHVSFSPDCPAGKRESVVDRRFEPRLTIVPELSSNMLLFQVHPETIEVFREDRYLCQVRWINGKMDYHQGGLPLKALEEMFKRSNRA